MTDQSLITLPQLLGLSGITAVLTFALNGARDWLISWRKNKGERQFDALQVAMSLEAFARQCASWIEDHTLFHDSEGNAGANHDEVPHLVYSDTITWKRFSVGLSEQALALPIMLTYANEAIAFAYHIADPHERPDEFEMQAGMYGFKALQLAQQFRLEYELTARYSPRRGWDFEAVLRRYHDKKSSQLEQLHQTLDSA